MTEPPIPEKLVGYLKHRCQEREWAVDCNDVIEFAEEWERDHSGERSSDQAWSEFREQDAARKLAIGVPSEISVISQVKDIIAGYKWGENMHETALAIIELIRTTEPVSDYHRGFNDGLKGAFVRAEAHSKNKSLTGKCASKDTFCAHEGPESEAESGARRAQPTDQPDDKPASKMSNEEYQKVDEWIWANTPKRDTAQPDEQSIIRLLCRESCAMMGEPPCFSGAVAGKDFSPCDACSSQAQALRPYLRSTEREAGWVIEHIDSSASAPDYFCGYITSEHAWSKDHSKALRFARYRDAEIIRDTHLSGGCHRIAEHIWESAPEEPRRG